MLVSVCGGEGGCVCEGTNGFPSVIEAQKTGCRVDQRWQR